MKKEELKIVKDSLLDVVKHEVGNPQARIDAARILLENFGSSEAEINLNDLAKTIKAAQQATRDTYEVAAPYRSCCTRQSETVIAREESECRHQGTIRGR